MTFKQFAKGFFQLPGTIFSSITGFIFGSNKKDDDGKYKLMQDSDAMFIYDQNDAPVYEKNHSLLGWLSVAGRAVGNFFSDHKTAISTAFWTSLVLGGAAALTVALWPAALAAVATFSIGGLSIAGIVGTGFAAQVAAVGGVAAVAASFLSYTGAAVVNGVSALVARFSSDSSDLGEDYNGSQQSPLAGLGGSTAQATQQDSPAPYQGVTLLADATDLTKGQRFDKVADEASDSFSAQV